MYSFLAGDSIRLHQNLPECRLVQRRWLLSGKVVPMLVYRPEGKPMSPGFESVSVQPETEITCQCDKKASSQLPWQRFNRSFNKVAFARIFPSVRQSSMSGRWKGGVKEWCGNKGGSCLFPTVPCSWCGPLPGRWVVFGGFFLHCSCWFPYLFRRLYAEWQSCNRHLHDVRVWTSLKIFHVSRYCLSKAHRPAWAWH